MSVLSIGKPVKPFFDHRYAFIEFIISYYQSGDFVSYDDIRSDLWDGQDSWNGKFLPDGEGGE